MRINHFFIFYHDASTKKVECSENYINQSVVEGKQFQLLHLPETYN